MFNQATLHHQAGEEELSADAALSQLDKFEKVIEQMNEATNDSDVAGGNSSLRSP